MAPALPEAPRVFDPCRETDPESGAVDPCRRRALVPVNNVALHMDEDEMGLHAADNLAKDSQEMEQILVELGGGDLGQVDLLQAIKTIDSGGDSLSTGDPEAIFPLHGFDLAEAVESESDAAEDKIRLQQTRLERRCAFLLRRLRILQARALGKRVSEEAAQVFERYAKVTRRDGVGRPLGVKAMLKRIETTATLQANTAARSIAKPSYFHTGTSSKTDVGRSATMGVQSGTFSGLEETAGALRSHLSIVKHELDSDATDTSSGAESNDENVNDNNPDQHKPDRHMPIEERALWSWQRRRASKMARFGWLQAQVQELDYKIRQHTDLLEQVREAKGPIEFEGEPTAYNDSLPGSPELADDNPARDTCSRIRPLHRDCFKKRKLLQLHKLHHATDKAGKPADIRCGCQWPVSGCTVCTGRPVATQPPPPHSTLAARQRLALLDPGYHNPLSDINAYERNSRHLREALIFCFNMKKSAAEAHRMLSNTYDQHGGGREKVVQDAKLEALLDKDSCQTQQEWAGSLGVTQQAISKCLKVTGMIQKQGHWMPYELKLRDVERRLFACKQLLKIMGICRLCFHVDGQTEYLRFQDHAQYLHDNARPHVAKVVKTYLETLKWEVLPQPPYSPDVAPSAYHLFRSMAHSLVDQHFRSSEEIKN
ncbi:Mariner Mos1 transposase [Eumeta japonica]|uniref:Mariner Mos1 transposase n=1 Tax=Eumeta variegata TaxID=151549 RepID=A0A4C1V7U4_EUMVA|nr:Mariner Mos1 transposase [Eumeta japonica]